MYVYSFVDIVIFLSLYPLFILFKIPSYGAPKLLAHLSDVDVNEFVRIADTGPRNRRRVSIAAPTGMYRRMMNLRHEMLQRQQISRRNSFSFDLRLDKVSSEEDQRLAERFSKELKEGIHVSLSVAKQALLEHRLLDNEFAISGVKRKSKAGHILGMSRFASMLVPYKPLQPDFELKQILIRLVDKRMIRVLRAHTPSVSVSERLNQIQKSKHLNTQHDGEMNVRKLFSFPK